MTNYFKLRINNEFVKKKYNRISEAMKDAGEIFQQHPEYGDAQIYEVTCRLALNVSNKNKKRI